MIVGHLLSNCVKESQSFLIYPLKKPVHMLLLMSITIHIYVSGYTKPDNLKRITRNIIRIISDY